MQLARGHKVTLKPSTGTASKISENTLSKGNSATKVVKFMILVVVMLAFVFGGGGDGSPNNTTETTALSDQASLQSNLPIQDLPIQDIRHSQKIDPHESDYERIWQDSSNYPHTEETDQSNEEETNASISGAVTSHESLLQDTSNLLVEESTNHTNGEPHNSSEASKRGSREWASSVFLNFIMILHISFWPVALLFVAYQLLSSFRLALVSSPSSKEKIKLEAKMEPTTPATPTGPRRNRDSFLTPPLSCKNGANEPTEWMSPCYGEGAIDVSVYKSMKATELRELLRNRKYDTRGDKEKMIKMLVMSYQNELACLTVQQLRPKLRRRNLSQKGTKKDIVRRLVEAGPSCR